MRKLFRICELGIITFLMLGLIYAAALPIQGIIESRNERIFTNRMLHTYAAALADSNTSAETWELAVQPWDKEDLPSGHKRAKAGDIVAVKPYPWNWGGAELRNYLIVIVENMTEEEMLELASPLYLDDNRGTLESPGVVTGKRKFKLDIDKLKLNILPTLDKTKLQDQGKTENYQPFKDAGVRIAIDTLEADLMQNKFDLKWRKGKKNE
jgi:hypothetical protein